jgi:hypothetical protein
VRFFSNAHFLPLHNSASGYYGSVAYTFNSTQPSGCTQCPVGKWSNNPSNSVMSCTSVSCTSKLGYTGSAGSCQCSDGYGGTVNYTNGVLNGCTACQNGYWAISGSMTTCQGISCSGVGYAGTVPGKCTCAENYNGTGKYS